MNTFHKSSRRPFLLQISWKEALRITRSTWNAISEIWGGHCKKRVCPDFLQPPYLSVHARAETNGFSVPACTQNLSDAWRGTGGGELLSFSCSLSLGWEALEPGAKVGRQANLLSGVCPSWWFPTVRGGQAEPSFSKLWFPCVPNDHNSFLKHVGEDTPGNIPNAPRKCLERSRNPTPAPPHPFPTSLRSWF